MVLQGRRERYTCESEPHARGGQAWVYRGTDSTGRAVAVKVCQEAGEAGSWMDREREEVTRLLREYPDLRRWLVEILDFGETPRGHRFVVMPWFHQTLQAWLANKPLEERFRALACAAEAVNQLHRSERDVRQGVVHRDVKPSNFLVAEEGGELRVVLSDFGSVKRAHLRTASLDTGRHTPGFAPPDQALPRKVVPDQCWDTYALAVTVFWGLTGEVPAAAQEAASLLTEDGRKLMRLAQSVSLSDSRRQELEALSGRDLAALVDLPRLRPLYDEDRELLKARLEGSLAGRVTASEPLAAELAAELGEILADALEPDPRRRSPDVRPIRTRCEQLARRVAREVARRQEAVSGAPAPDGMTVTQAWKQHLAAGVPPKTPPVGPTVLPAQAKSPGLRPVPPTRTPVKPASGHSDLKAKVGFLAGTLVLALAALIIAAGVGSWVVNALTNLLGSIGTAAKSQPGEIRELAGIRMAWIPAGTFLMGSVEEGMESVEDDELPLHPVTITRGFWLMETEVSQEAWQMMMGNNPAKGTNIDGATLEGLRYPVFNINWCDAVLFANRMSDKHGLKRAYSLPEALNSVVGEDTCSDLDSQVTWDRGANGYRLPTEAEWEYAAKAGNTILYSGTDDPSLICEYANVLTATTAKQLNYRMEPFECEDKYSLIAPIGAHAQNPWGLKDMTGNLWEWCFDTFDDKAYSADGRTDPVVLGTKGRIIRGGSWYTSPYDSRIATRGTSVPGKRAEGTGLRLARSAP